MPSRRFHVYVEKDIETGLFAARCLELNVFSQGKTNVQALKNIREAISLHLDALEDELKGKNLIEVELQWPDFPERSLGRIC
jgi:predicted RNase H-like HicB family nuclease